jgi:hypothetical protein
LTADFGSADVVLVLALLALSLQLRPPAAEKRISAVAANFIVHSLHDWFEGYQYEICG